MDHKHVTRAGLGIALLWATPSHAQPEPQPRSPYLVIDAPAHAAGRFGARVDLDQDLLLVAGSWNSSTGFVEAYLYSPSTGEPLGTLTTPATGNPSFVPAATLAGDTALIANEPSAACNVYQFDVSNPAAPVLVRALTHPDGGNQSLFGGALALGRGLVFVADESYPQPNDVFGAVFVFDIATGQPVGRLDPPPGSAPFGQFGSQVKAQNDLVIVCDADNAVHLFDIANLSFISTITKPNPTLGGGFGADVALAGNDLFVGADNGRAVFRYNVSDPSTPVLLSTFIPKLDGQLHNGFGFALNAEDSSLVVGAPSATVDGITSGSAFVFNLPVISQRHRLTTNSPVSGGFVGAAVDIRENIIAVGEASTTSPTAPGRVLVYHPGSGPGCRADMNADGIVDSADLYLIIDNFSFNSQAPFLRSWCDQNNDGFCTPADFTAWIANYNLGCSGT